MPLLNTLHYEVSAINAILISLFAGYTTLFYNKKRIEAEDLFLLEKKYFLHLFGLFIIPFVISLISTIICQNCPISEGIYLYLIIVAPSLIIGSTIAIFASFITKRFPYLLFTFLWILLLFSFVPELYFNPQIYFYNPIFAYFPGTMYDQNIEISKTLLFYRIINVVFAVAVLFVIKVFVKSKKVSKLIIISMVMVFYLMFGLAKSSLGFSTSIEKIKQEVKGFAETEHFKIIFPGNISETEKKLLIFNHEFYYNEIKNLLNIELKNKITSILFKTGAQKKLLFGSGNADVAKLWMNQIYLNYENYDNSLKHEIAHVFSSPIATGLFKMPDNYNPAMLEGFAMAIENNFDDFDIDYLTALAIENNYKVSLKNLFSNFSFFTKTSSLSYLYAGSFIKYLAEKYGWRKVKLLYSNLHFKKIYNKNISLLESEYLKYLKNKKYKNNKPASNLYFGRLPLVKRICPRATAKGIKNAWKLFKEKDYIKALEKFEQVYQYSKTYSSLFGIVETSIKLKNFKKAKKLLESEINNYKNTAYYYSLENILGNVYANIGEKELAEKIFTELARQNPRYNYRNIALVKLFLLQNNTKKLINYLNNENERIDILRELLVTKPDDAVIQTILLQKIDKYKNTNELKNEIVTIAKNYKYSSDTYFQLSKFALRFLEIKNAEYFGELSLQNVKPERKEIIEEYLKKIKFVRNLTIQDNNHLTMQQIKN